MKYTPCPPNCWYCTDPHYGHPEPHPGQKPIPESEAKNEDEPKG